MNTPSTPHRPPRTDHQHDRVPLETAFDFLNTLELDDDAPELGLVERLTSLQTAANWLVDHQVIPDPRWITRLGRRPAAESATLDRLLTTRTALRDVAHAVAHGDAPSGAALDEVNRALAARETVQLVAAPDGVRLGHSHHGDAVDDVLARIAEPIAREIGDGREDRFRICANDTCAWLFFDESRPGNRRWCDMATCGNQAKARRHRARQKSSGPAAAAARPD
ncbi:MAG TPA: CGNR zinc finger domain-containing protein [Candidatus Limnocylindrales bacterium]|nr:CGNR zinc finger domain-containing protein [Candidatus Limnocylindrales bacterium]